VSGKPNTVTPKYLKSMKKLTLFTVSIATMFFCTKPVSAAAINFICNEKQGTMEKETARSGKTEEKLQNYGVFQLQLILLMEEQRCGGKSAK